MSNQKPLIKDGQTTQWPKEKGQKYTQCRYKVLHIRRKIKPHEQVTLGLVIVARINVNSIRLVASSHLP